MMELSHDLSLSRAATHRMFQIFDSFYSMPHTDHDDYGDYDDDDDLAFVAFTCAMIASKLHDHAKFHRTLVTNTFGCYSHAEVMIRCWGLKW